MATVEARICDLCLGEGEHTLAIGSYTTDNGTWDVCEGQHSEQVKAVGFTIDEFDEPGDILY